MTIAIAMKMKNRILAKPPAADETPEKPNAPAMIETTKAMRAHLSRVMWQVSGVDWSRPPQMLRLELRSCFQGAIAPLRVKAGCVAG